MLFYLLHIKFSSKNCTISKISVLTNIFLFFSVSIHGFFVPFSKTPSPLSGTAKKLVPTAEACGRNAKTRARPMQKEFGHIAGAQTVGFRPPAVSQPSKRCAKASKGVLRKRTKNLWM